MATGVTPGTPALTGGYSLVQRDGKRLYCRQAVSTGSVLRKEICLTADELKYEQSATREVLDARKRARCGSADCVFH
jgi:hypothetical protein